METVLVLKNNDIVQEDKKIALARVELQEQYHEQWLANYKNETDVSQWAMGFIKETYSGRGEYLAWSVMVSALKMLDSLAKVTVLENDEDGGFVFTQKIKKPTRNYQQTTTREVDSKDGEVIKETLTNVDVETEAQIHFVKVRIDYKGMTHIEEYPILDNSHNPTDNLNSAIVNKNIQRAKARGIATVTGVGFSLWTQEDQEVPVNELKEEPKEVEKPKPKTKPKAGSSKKKETEKADEEEFRLDAILSVDGKPLPIHEEVARFITINKDDEELLAKLKQMSPVIDTQSGMSLKDALDNEEQLAELFSKVDRLENLYKVLRG